MSQLTYADVYEAISGDSVAFRSRTRLQPAGGRGEKVFPPTYATGDSAKTRYALETRRVDGEDVETVVLDSVASQANRIELAILEAWETGDIEIPVAAVDFEVDEKTADLGRITTLEAPHRIMDALFRDSELDGVPFRLSDVGKAITEASPKDATPLLTYSPTSLVFGVWDSTGPKGGLGAKYPRAIYSEIVGYGAEPGVKSGSRIDPAQIEKIDLYEREDGEGWTADPEQAEKSGNSPVLYGGGSDKGRPSAINHGNVTPTIDAKSGGVTIDYAEQTAVLSLPALRRLRFPTRPDGERIERSERKSAELAARAALAAVGLAGLALQRRNGFDLRSRCLLLPEGPFELELLPADGSEPRTFSLDFDAATKLLGEAGAKLNDVGMPWHDELITLKPAEKLIDLIHRSRNKAKNEAEVD